MKPDETLFEPEKTTAFENCFIPLLEALKWRGNERTLKEALPHYSKVTTPGAFCDVMAHLNYESNTLQVDIEKLDKRLMPSLLVTETYDVMVLLGIEDGKLKIFDGITNKINYMDSHQASAVFHKATLYVFKRQIKGKEAKSGWLRDTFRNNRGLIINSIILSLVLNLLVLGVPLFVMAVYDRVISTSSYSLLNEFSIGMLITLIGIFLVYRTRAHHLAMIGARCDKALGDKIVSQLLYLAPMYTETATAGAQVARIKDFDRVREFISGPFLTTFFELPFIVIALVVIGLLSGLLVLIPIVLILVYVILMFIMLPRIRRTVRESAVNATTLQEFLLESIENLRVIKYTASVNRWSELFRNYSAKSNISGVRVAVYNAIDSSISEGLMIAAGMLMVAFGAVRAMTGDLTIGALLALMILIWRVLSPIRSIFNVLPRIIQILDSARQISRLMDLKPETEQAHRSARGKIDFHGDVSFQRVSIRYPAAYTPSLFGVSFNLTAGSLCGIVGRNGSGKSTVLKVLMGLYQPQAGAVLIDNSDIRQLNPIDLRNSLGYLPQRPELFYGTIAANLRLGDPTATDEDLYRAATDAGVIDDILRLPHKFNTLLTDQSTQQMASSFRQSLCLARAYLRSSKILLLDEPANTLDQGADQRFMKYIESLRGKVTVIMVTHRPSHLKLMDTIIFLDQGQVVVQGAPADILSKIPFDYL